MNEIETAALDGLTLDVMLARLPREDERLLRRHLDGEALTHDEQLTAQRLTHELAISARAQKACDACKRLRPAEEFGWTAWAARDALGGGLRGGHRQSLCLACEKPWAAHKRSSHER